MAISLAAASGIAVYALWRGGYVRPGSGAVTGLFGYSLAATGLAPTINHMLQSVAGWVSNF